MNTPPPPTALLTGCASGIGRRLTGELARRGHRVLATDVDSAALEAAAAADGWPLKRVCRRALDVRDGEGWRRAVAEVVAMWGHLDRLFNVAGYTAPAFVHEIEAEEIDRHLDVNVRGVILGTRAAAPAMVARGAGHILNFASLAGIASAPGLSLYSAAKFAVRGFSLAAAQELGPRGVAVTVICPDAVATPMLERQVDRPAAAMSFTRAQPLSAAEVAAAVLDRALPRRPMELAIPAHRGWLARFAGAFPALAARAAPRYMARGRARQEALRRRREAGRADDGQ